MACGLEAGQVLSYISDKREVPFYGHSHGDVRNWTDASRSRTESHHRASVTAASCSCFAVTLIFIRRSYPETQSLASTSEAQRIIFPCLLARRPHLLVRSAYDET
jgi:hypothetical protein